MFASVLAIAVEVFPVPYAVLHKWCTISYKHSVTLVASLCLLATPKYVQMFC